MKSTMRQGTIFHREKKSKKGGNDKSNLERSYHESSHAQDINLNGANHFKETRSPPERLKRIKGWLGNKY